MLPLVLQESVQFASGTGRATGPALAELVVMDRAHPERAQAEAMVRAVYARSFGARLSAFYPWLLALRGHDGGFRAVAGLRAGHERLFSEHYLSHPVEELVDAPRSHIVELGNLATLKSGEIRAIIAAATAFLQGAGFSQVVFTVVPLLYNSFRRLGLPLRQLAAARLEALPEAQRADWGSYYDCHPAVYTGRIAYGYHALAEAVANTPALARLWADAFTAGQAALPRIRGGA